MARRWEFAWSSVGVKVRALIEQIDAEYEVVFHFERQRLGPGREFSAGSTARFPHLADAKQYVSDQMATAYAVEPSKVIFTEVPRR